ncbi:alpha-N-acetylgalactosaminide alpha-2,6-sialyltransferase 1-like [Bombina bombina]|uniref:alpha-N-acetylgalactosaminide alpha-2,6-sialyltransferase 1-like n=1 Tax=Bombina bombina TaxID=8345 RepID=UPI00235A7D75|nr:alpha-N-acetylgalactosaminide alpha-2,6-sialyltransferase 1-like [Bombina bombina]
MPNEAAVIRAEKHVTQENILRKDDFKAEMSMSTAASWDGEESNHYKSFADLNREAAALKPLVKTRSDQLTTTGDHNVKVNTKMMSLGLSNLLNGPSILAKTLSGRSVMTVTKRPLRKDNFTAEPRWDFEEDYSLDPSSTQTSCPISVKIKALNSSWLKELVLPKVTIFMDRHHWSHKEWKRLGHFIPPYGWMELNYTVVKAVVSALPLLSKQQILLVNSSTDHRCVSCAVIGNGGILNGSRLGKEIDSHDYVFRVNGAVVEGYEDDVGKRTSFYGFTAFTMLSSLYLLKNNGFSKIPMDKETKYILFTEGMRDYEWLKALQQNKEISKGTLEYYRLRPRDDFGASFDLKRLLVAHPDFMRYLKNRFLRSELLDGKYWNLYRPSTGALVLLTALHLCDTVSAYGFMTDDYTRYSDHYYDKNKLKMTLYINHDFLLERDLWRRLNNENIIKLYKRT